MNAVDYLLKPIDRTWLADTLHRAQDRLEQADLRREDIAPNPEHRNGVRSQQP